MYYTKNGLIFHLAESKLVFRFRNFTCRKIGLKLFHILSFKSNVIQLIYMRSYFRSDVVAFLIYYGCDFSELRIFFQNGPQNLQKYQQQR